MPAITVNFQLSYYLRNVYVNVIIILVCIVPNIFYFRVLGGIIKNFVFVTESLYSYFIRGNERAIGGNEKVSLSTTKLITSIVIIIHYYYCNNCYTIAPIIIIAKSVTKGRFGDENMVYLIIIIVFA